MNTEKELLIKELDLKFDEIHKLAPMIFDFIDRIGELNKEEYKTFKELGKKQSKLNSEISKIMKELKKL